MREVVLWGGVTTVWSVARPPLAPGTGMDRSVTVMVSGMPNNIGTEVQKQAIREGKPPRTLFLRRCDVEHTQIFTRADPITIPEMPSKRHSRSQGHQPNPAYEGSTQQANGQDMAEVGLWL